MRNVAAVAYANHGVGRSTDLTRLSRAVKERGVRLSRTAAALSIAGRGNTAANALSRPPLRAIGGDPFPDRDLRARFHAQVGAECGDMDVDMMARGDGGNAWGPAPLSPSRYAFQGPHTVW